MVELDNHIRDGARNPTGPQPVRGEGGSPATPTVRDLVLAHYQAVFRYAYRLSGRAPEAEDLTQQTFLLAQRKLHQLREPEKAIRWLFAILRSCYLKSERKRRPVAAANLELNVDTVPDGNSLAARGEDIDQERLQRAIEELPEPFKVVLLMFYFEELSYKDIAAKLDIQIGTVMSRLSRAKTRLRTYLAAREEHPPDSDTTGQRAPLPASPSNSMPS
jgi:RNA polymerase sigma-70 factor (ECF subfamily)